LSDKGTWLRAAQSRCQTVALGVTYANRRSEVGPEWGISPKSEPQSYCKLWF